MDSAKGCLRSLFYYLEDINRFWDPKPFRFNSHCLPHIGLPELVSNFWNTAELYGWKAFVLLEKLKTLKGILKSWNIEVFGNLDSQIDRLREECSKIDSLIDDGEISRDEIESRSTALSELFSLLITKDSQLCQRSQSKWLKFSDAKFRFFNAYVK